MENWKSIPGYEGLYEASDMGRIRSVEGKKTTNARCNRVWKQRIMKLHFTKRSKDGSLSSMVTLWKNGEHKQLLVARLVASTWCKGYEDGLTVNHIDGNPLNNCAGNLEWVTINENIKHSYKIGLRRNANPCVLKDKEGNTFEFYSMSEASRFLGRKNASYLSTAIKHGTKIYSVSGEAYGLA